MKLKDLGKMVHEQPLVPCQSEMWIATKDGHRAFLAIFMGLGATGEVLRCLVENDLDAIPDECEEGLLAFVRSSPMTGEVVQMPISNISSVAYHAKILNFRPLC